MRLLAGLHLTSLLHVRCDCIHIGSHSSVRGFSDRYVATYAVILITGSPGMLVWQYGSLSEISK